MSRDRANIRIDMWGDDDVRALSPMAQWLYMVLLTSSTLNYAGVADWRPARLVGLAAGSTRSLIEDAGAELERAFFIVTDQETEEVLIRSFLRHDGVMQKPNVAVAMAKAYAGLASKRIRGVLVHELNRLAAQHPEWVAWEKREVQLVLSGTAIDPKANQPIEGSYNPSGNPSAKGLAKGSEVDPSLQLPLHATPTATSSKEDGSTTNSRGARLAEDWKPSGLLLEYARTKAPSVDIEVEDEKFRNFWLAKAGAAARKVSWERTWQNWMLEQHQRNVNRGWIPTTPVAEPGLEWMQR